MNSATQDSEKALQEKFALTRELSRLRPEIEHLQSQLSTHQTVISERNELRRQLESLEVEHENEKKSQQRSRVRETAGAEELKERLETTESTLAFERKEHEKMKRKTDEELMAANGQIERLEERISGLKLKLKGAQIELKDSQAETARYQLELKKATVASKAPKSTGAKVAGAKKIRVREQMADEMAMIGTPGIEDVAAKRPYKKRAADQTLMGEKSVFSITPFLNRSKRPDDDDDSREQEPQAGSDAKQDAELSSADEISYLGAPTPTVRSTITGKGSKVGHLGSVSNGLRKQVQSSPKGQGGPHNKALDESPASKKNVSANPPTKQTKSATVRAPIASAPAGPALGEDFPEPVDEPVEEENAPAAVPQKRVRMLQNKEHGSNASMLESDAKKKKRKLLSGSTQTLFADENLEAMKPPVKTNAGQTRKLNVKLGARVGNAFASSSFSPLKRDRRGVHASFLA